MSEQGNNQWWVVIAAAFPSAASGFWVVWRWWTDRHDRRDEKLLTREEQVAKRLDEQQARLTKEASDIIDDLRAIQAELRGNLAAAERERIRWERIARNRHDQLSDLHIISRNYGHNLDNLQTIVASCYERWAPNEMPQIVPRKPLPPIPLGIED